MRKYSFKEDDIMSIYEIYEADGMTKAIDVAEHNCAVCMEKCSNVNCPNMKAIMDKGEKTPMTKDEKERYFNLVGA